MELNITHELPVPFRGYLTVHHVGAQADNATPMTYRPCLNDDGDVIEHYYVAAYGTVISTKRLKPHIMSPTVTGRRWYVPMRINRKTRVGWLSRLVAYAWIGFPPSPDHRVCHLDGDASNNTARNLRWATQKEIVHRSYELGLPNNRMLSERQIATIRRLRIDGKTFQDIADDVGSNLTTVGAVIRGRERFEGSGIEESWIRNVRSSKLTAEEVLAIREAYSAGHCTQKELAETYDIDPSTVSYIVRRRSWKHLRASSSPTLICN